MVCVLYVEIELVTAVYPQVAEVAVVSAACVVVALGYVVLCVGERV